MAQASTFDILLFKTNTIPAKTIRAYTRSEFDHIAMVIKMASLPNEVLLLESTSCSGVHLSRFSEKKLFIGTYFKKLVYRKLTWNEKQDNIQFLMQFCKETEHSSYSLKGAFKSSQSLKLPKNAAGV